MMPDDLHRLQKACAGLRYPSESDYPLTVFEWIEATGDALEAVEQHTGLAEFEETSPEEFFADLLASDPSSERIQALKTVSEELLAEPRVFRAGAIEVRIFLIGRSPSGRWLGIETIAVET